MPPIKRSNLLLAAATTALLVIVWNPGGLLPGLRTKLPGKGAELVTEEAGKRAERPADAKRGREAIDAAAERWYREQLAKHPELQIQYREVADSQNGHLQLLAFLGEFDKFRGLPDFERLGNLIQGGKEYDPALLAKWLDGHEDLLAEILRIAELPDRSAKGIAATRTAELASWGSRLDAPLLLLGHARLAGAGGDTAGALRSYQAAVNLAAHFDGVEAPATALAISAANIRGQVADRLMEDLLPQVAGDAAMLKEIRSLLERTAEAEPDYRQLAIGNWNSGLRAFILPALLGDAGAQQQLGIGERPPITNQELFLDAYAAQVAALAKTFGAAGFEEAANPALPQIAADFPRGDRETLDFILTWDLVKPVQGLRFGGSNLAMKIAAVAILQGQVPPVEPLTGQPFVWNPATRTLSQPAKLAALHPSLAIPLVLP